jgi:hypothetical protein
MALTKKHSLRIPDDIWLPGIDQAEEIARMGVRGDHEAFAVVDIVRRALAPCATETPVETMLRLGMHDELRELGLLPQETPADA